MLNKKKSQIKFLKKSVFILSPFPEEITKLRHRHEAPHGRENFPYSVIDLYAPLHDSLLWRHLNPRHETADTPSKYRMRLVQRGRKGMGLGEIGAEKSDRRSDKTPLEILSLAKNLFRGSLR